jgi:hypothetical protein
MKFVVSHSHTVGRSRSGQSYQVLRSDIGRENRRTDNEPAKIATGKKVIVGRILSLGNYPPGYPEKNCEISRYHYPVQTYKRSSTNNLNRAHK